MTYEEVREGFRERHKLPEEMQRKCVSFYLAMGREAGIPLSRDILSRLKPRSSPSAKRASISSDPGPPAVGSGRPGLVQEVLRFVMEVYDPDRMTPEEEQAVFTLTRYLKRRKRP